MGPPPPRDPVPEESDWRSSSRPRPVRDNISPPASGSSTPPTPQMGRRKLELLPRSSSNVPSPLSSPKIGAISPFGAAKPVDVTTRENEVAQKLELRMSRNSSRSGVERPAISRNNTTTPPASATSQPSSPPAPAAKVIPQGMSANVRPAFSFASAAAKKKNAEEAEEAEESQTIAEKLGEVTI